MFQRPLLSTYYQHGSYALDCEAFLKYYQTVSNFLFQHYRLRAPRCVKSMKMMNNLNTLLLSPTVVQVFRPRTPPEAIALCSRLLEYTPTARLTPLEACAHSFFDELRDPNIKLPNGREKPSLFNFTTQGML